MSRVEYQINQGVGAQQSDGPTGIGRVLGQIEQTHPLFGSAGSPGLVPARDAVDNEPIQAAVQRGSPVNMGATAERRIEVGAHDAARKDAGGTLPPEGSPVVQETTVVTSPILAEETEEPTPKRLSKRQEKQILRRIETSIEDFLELRDAIVETGRQTVRAMRANPYAPEAEQTFRENFQDREYTDDVRRAIVLAEPEETTQQASPQKERVQITDRAAVVRQRKEAFLQELDTTADVVMRLLDFVTERSTPDNEWWQQSDANKYEQLMETAFGMTDQDAIDQKYARAHQRDIRLGVVNMIEDYHRLEDYRGKLTDPQTQRETVEKALSEFLEDKHLTDDIEDLHLTGEIVVESFPLGFVVYLEEDDFFKLAKKKYGFVSDAGDGALQSRIAVMRLPQDGKASSAGALKANVLHEKRHVIFNNYFEEYENSVPVPTAILSEAENSQHAKRVRLMLTEFAKNELIAYAEHMPDEWIRADSLGVGNYMYYLNDVYHYIWGQKDMSVEQRAAFFAPYINNYTKYLDQISEYQLIARKLFEKSASSDPTNADALTKEKVRALLHIIPVHEARRLGVYLGIDIDHLDEEFETLYKQEQAEAIEKFTSSVARMVEITKTGALTEEQLEATWHDGIHSKNLNQVQFTYAKEAMPALLDVIKNSPVDFDIYVSIQVLELILYKHLADMSEQEFRTIKDSLDIFFSTRFGPRYQDAKERARALLTTLNERITPEGMNFDKKPIFLRVDEIRENKEGYLSPTFEQSKQIIDLLNAETSEDTGYIWSEYFYVGDIKVLAQTPEGLSLLMYSLGVSEERWVGLEVIKALDEQYDLLTVDQKKQADTLLTSGLEYVRLAQASPLAMEIKEEAEKLQFRLREEEGPFAGALYNSERFAQDIMDYWQHVVIEYGTTEGFLMLVDLKGDEIFDLYNQICAGLWLRDDLTIEQKTEVYTRYQDTLVRNLGQLQEFQWIAQKLYAKARVDSDGNVTSTDEVLTVEKVKELLTKTPMEEMRTLGVHFGVAPEAIREVMEQEQQEVLLNPYDGANIYEIMGTYHKEALPLITTLIEKRPAKATSIIAAEAILHMHYKDLSQEEITKVREALEKTLYKHETPADQLTAFRVLKEIDEVFLSGGVDFTQPEPFSVALRRVVQAPVDEKPSVEQIGTLAAMLDGQDALYWHEFFSEDYLTILAAQSEGASVLIDLGRADNLSIATHAAENLLEHPEYITDDLRSRVEELITHIRTYSNYANGYAIYRQFVDAGEALQKILQSRDERSSND